MVMKKKRIGKRGIDQQVATILLIALVIIILLLVFLWGRNFVESRAAKSGLLSERSVQCNDIKITASESRKAGNTAFVTLENTGEVRVEKLLFRVEGISPEEMYDPLFTGSTHKYEIIFEDSLDDVDEIQIVPWLEVAEAKFIPCSDKVLTLNLQE